MKQEDQAIVLACDGVWDVFTNDELGEYIIQRIKCSSPLDKACEETLDTSLFKVRFAFKPNLLCLLSG